MLEQDLLGFELGHLGVMGLDHLAVAEQLDLAGLAVDLGADVVVVAVFGAAGLLDRLFHCDDHDLAVDALSARDGVCYLEGVLAPWWSFSLFT